MVIVLLLEVWCIMFLGCHIFWQGQFFYLDGNCRSSYFILYFSQAMKVDSSNYNTISNRLDLLTEKLLYYPISIESFWLYPLQPQVEHQKPTKQKFSRLKSKWSEIMYKNVPSLYKDEKKRSGSLDSTMTNFRGRKYHTISHHHGLYHQYPHYPSPHRGLQKLRVVEYQLTNSLFDN